MKRPRKAERWMEQVIERLVAEYPDADTSTVTFFAMLSFNAHVEHGGNPSQVPDWVWARADQIHADTAFDRLATEWERYEPLRDVPALE